MMVVFGEPKLIGGQNLIWREQRIGAATKNYLIWLEQIGALTKNNLTGMKNWRPNKLGMHMLG